MEKIQLFCFPHAGGSSVLYRKWKKHLHESIELCPVELSGRGRRSDCYTYEVFQDMVDDVYNSIKVNLKNGKYAFFGHSMGAVVAYELFYKLKEENQKTPVHIFFSGRKAPGTYSNIAITHNLPEEEFKKNILNLGGAAENIFNLQGFSELYFPLLRRDVKLIEEYKYISGRDLIDCDISIFSGTQDKLSAQDSSSWEKHTSKKCRHYLFEGGHFFINDSKDSVIKTINSTLTSIPEK